jgi:GTP-binding protein HflX
MISCDVFLPYREGRLISLFHEHGLVERIEHMPEGVRISGRLPTALVGELKPWMQRLNVPENETQAMEEPALDDESGA